MVCSGMDRKRNNPRRPSLKRNSTLQRTPTFASLLCELQAQRPDLVAEWIDGEVGLVLAPIFTDSPEVVAAEFMDKVLAVRRGCDVVLYSPFLRRNVVASEADVALVAAPQRVTPIVKKPHKRRKKSTPVQKVEAA